MRGGVHGCRRSGFHQCAVIARGDVDVRRAADAGANRVAGQDRYETSARIVERFGTANAIVLANGTSAKDGADALAANYLAGRVGAPIVLVQADAMADSVLDAVASVLSGASPPTIYVMGGADSVSDAVAGKARAAAAKVATGTVTVRRISGAAAAGPGNGPDSTLLP